MGICFPEVVRERDLEPRSLMTSRLSRTITTAIPRRLLQSPQFLLARTQQQQQQQQQQQHTSRFNITPPVRTLAAMANLPPGKYEWLVVVPDIPGSAQKKLAVRAKHIEEIKALVTSGQIKTGGALLNSKPEGDDPSTFDWYGSTLVVVASSKEEVKALLAADEYASAGVWDVDNAQIWAAKFAI
ncbi:hypothetical protein F5X99DRAFT_407624 [Biscogniauxia marginata]|nr:hypothetical protein F5X99DRAFT_407624 [Biscogniauxia marginata]